MHSNNLLDRALDAAGRGWHVFPLRPDDKRPAFPDHLQDQCTHTDARCRTGHVGWEGRATTDPDRIRRGWATVPYGVGIACGPLRPGRHRPRRPQTRPDTTGRMRGLPARPTRVHRPVPPRGAAGTRTTPTPCAPALGGIHLYFRHPTGPALRNTAGQRGTGLGLADRHPRPRRLRRRRRLHRRRPPVHDHPRQRRRRLPAWLAERLTPTPPAPRPVTITPPTVRAGTYVDAAIRRQLGYLHHAAQGERNHALYVSAVALGQLAAGGALTDAEVTEVLTPAALAAGLTERETTRTIRSGLLAGARRPRRVA